MAIELPLHSPPPSFVYGLLAGAAIYTISRRLSPVLTSSLGGRSFEKRVSSLESGKLYHYHSLLPSTVHALLQIIGTFAFVFRGRRGYDYDVVGSSSASSSSPATLFDDRTIVPYGVTGLGPAVYMGIFVGYLLADVASAPSFGVMGYPFVVHHLAASACWAICACCRIMQPVGCLFQFNELSTPLMNVRQYLLTAGYQSSDAPVTVVTLLFFFTFGMVRIVPLPFVVREWVLRDFGAIRESAGTGIAVVVSLFFALNVTLQCGWFAIMCHKLVGMVIKKPKENGSIDRQSDNGAKVKAQ